MIASVQFQQLEVYSRTFTQRICKEIFETKTHLRGQDLLTLTSVQQVNYFVLKALYRAWQQEMLHIESPYFDYRQLTVRKALHLFMNTLSKYIRVGEEALVPLLEQACQDTLRLLLSPQQFFYQELVTAPQVLSTTYLRNTQKYLRINTHVMSAFQAYFDAEDEQEISSERAAELLQLCEEEFASVEKVEEYLFEFNTILPLPEELWPQKCRSENTEEAAQQKTISTVEKRVPNEYKNTSEKASSAASNSGTATETKEANVSQTSSDKEQWRETSSQFSYISRTQADNFARLLFNNKRQLFLQALKEVSKSKSFDKAVEMLLQSYGKPYQWNMESPEVKEFFKQIFLFFR